MAQHGQRNATQRNKIGTQWRNMGNIGNAKQRNATQRNATKLEHNGATWATWATQRNATQRIFKQHFVININLIDK